MLLLQQEQEMTRGPLQLLQIGPIAPTGRPVWWQPG